MAADFIRHASSLQSTRATGCFLFLAYSRRVPTGRLIKARGESPGADAFRLVASCKDASCGERHMLDADMPQSLASPLIHIVFSTKHREKWLDDDLRPSLFAYMATVGRDLGCEVFRVGGVSDHVHLAVDLSRTITIADFVKKVKQTSNVWLKQQSRSHASFEWQAGYGAFSVGRSQLSKLTDYIERQEEHHRRLSFKEEYLALLAKYGVTGDERYLWD